MFIVEIDSTPLTVYSIIYYILINLLFHWNARKTIIIILRYVINNKSLEMYEWIG